MQRAQLGLLLIVALAVGSLHDAEAGSLSIRATTTPAGGNYAPRNVVAVWIEDANGTFIKTIARWADVRKGFLVAWSAAAGVDADAISGATRANHATPLVINWDLKNKAGVEVPPGTYRIRMELADRNSNMATQNNQGTFTFVKNGTSSTQNTSGGGFTDVMISFSTVAPVCNNGVIEFGETCDPPGSCPTSCTPATNACLPNNYVGSAAMCNAACVPGYITECVGGDGCCPGPCTKATDSDCKAAGPGSGSGSGDGSDDGVDDGASGGCQVGGADGASLLLLVLGLGFVATRRRRA